MIRENFRVLNKEHCRSLSAQYNIVLFGFIELTSQLYGIGEPVCN
jgi:hypothetical protein